MKFKLTFLISIFFLFIFFLAGCSNPDIIKEKKIEFLDKTELENNTTVYRYKFKFNGSAWMDVSAYVKKENLNYIISINDPIENNLNSCTYMSDLDEQNLEITNRVKRETVSNLDEAIEKSIYFYLADNI